MDNVVKLAVDAYRGNVEKYSQGQSMDVLRKALIEANGGSTKLNYKNIRDGKCVGLFSIVEEVLSKTLVDDLTGDYYFQNLVEFRNVAEGDQNVFLVDNAHLFTVADAAAGTQGIRRQRLEAPIEVPIPTTVKVVKVYEELNRVLAGRVDFNVFIQRVSDSFRRRLLDDAYGLWSKVTAADLGGLTYFPTAGTYNENALLDLIAHVEAAAGGKTATIIGTKKAIRKLDISAFGEIGKADLYNMGYAGKFYGTPVVVTPQRHKVGTSEFTLPDNIITIIAGDEKPIKCVYEGDPLIIMGDPTNNGDLTHEYFVSERYGMGLVVAAGNAGIGRYEMTA